MDETSMTANPDLADVIAQAAATDAKVILAGDTQHLQAVQNGGGLSLLAEAHGFVQLAEPVRFRAEWEQAASLRLRAGDTTVLAEYDQHARVTGGDPEQMMDTAAADYLALTVDGTDVLLMAADHTLRRELSRRIRDDLIRLGIVTAGPAVHIADGTTAKRRGPDHLHQERPHGRSGGARPDAGQRRPPPRRRGHLTRLGRPPGAGRRPGHRAAALDRPHFLRAAWHEALAALGPADGPDVRGMPDGRLLHLRDTYPVETAWAPQYVGDELRQVRAAAREARLAGLRAAAEAAAADKNGDPDAAARQHELAASYHALQEAYQQRETFFAAVMADRADWDAATRAQRHLAVAAAAELRRRHPDQHHPPLRSAEPEPATDTQRAELTLTPGDSLAK